MIKRGPLSVLFLTIFIDLLLFGMIIPVLPVFATQLNASPFVVGMIMGVFALMNFLFGPFWGSLSDRYGRRPIILTSIVITIIANITLAFSNTLLLLFIARILSGIGSANISAAQAYIADISAPEERAKKMGFLGVAFGLGFIFGPPIGGLLKSLSPDGSMIWLGSVCALMGLINFVLAYNILPESLKVFNTDQPIRIKPLAGIVNELRKPFVNQLFYINFIYITAFSMMQITAVILWEQVYGLDEKQIGYVFAFIGFTSALVQGLLVGPLTKMFGERKLLLIGSILMAFGLLSIPFPSVESFIPWELLSLLLIALANGCVTPSITSLISQYTSPKEQGKVLGMNLSFSSIARVVGPVSGGYLYGMSIYYPYVAGFIVMMMASVLALVIWKRNEQLKPVL